MRIAVSGTHFSGKSTLVEALSEALPQYKLSKSRTPSCRRRDTSSLRCPLSESFELQMERSIELLDEGEPNVIFDRCPADFLGYSSRILMPTHSISKSGWLAFKPRSGSSIWSSSSPSKSLTG